MLTLYKALQGAKKAAAIANQGLNPVLQCVHIASKGDIYIVQASNGYLVARYVVKAPNPSPVNVCILAKDLTRLPVTVKAAIGVQDDTVTINGAEYPRYTGANYVNGVYIDIGRYWPQEWALVEAHKVADLTSRIKATTGDCKLVGATLDRDYALLALKHLQSPVVAIRGNSRLGPVLFDGGQAQWLIMPIRV